MLRATETLFQAIVESFTLSELEILVRYRLRLDLERVARSRERFDTIVYDLIGYAERNRILPMLIAAVRDAVPPAFGLETLYEETFETPFRGTKAELEQLLSQEIPHLEPVPFREESERLEPAVCAIEIGKKGAFRLSGTGFLVGPDLLLTNFHVMAPAIAHAKGQVSALVAAPSDVRFRFDYKRLRSEESALPGVYYGLKERDWLVASSPQSPFDFGKAPQSELPAKDELDYALVRLDAPAGEHSIGVDQTVQGMPRRGWIRPAGERVSYVADSPLLILHHPGNRSLKLTIDMRSIIALNGNGTRLWHRTNTETGSSGAPCFNAAWDLIALHQGGHTSAEGPYNQAIPIDPIWPAVAGAAGAGRP
ncbi:MAG: serine protease [Acidobacteriota bacterium]